MGVIGNASYKPIQHKLDTLKKTMINEGISIIGLIELKSNWIKIPIKENIYNSTYGWFKTRRISQGITKSPSPMDHFKVESQLSWR